MLFSDFDTPGPPPKIIFRRMENFECQTNESDFNNQISQFILKHEDVAQFYTGFSKRQREILWDFLGQAKYHLTIIGPRPRPNTSLEKASVQCQFLLFLMIFRRNKTFKECGLLFDMSPTLIGEIFHTWLQFIYYKFLDMNEQLFVKRKDLPKLPKCFRNPLLRKCRVVIDCTELKCESTTNYTQLGDLYSSYKGCTTLKILIGTSPGGCAMFISKCYPGRISDREITNKERFCQKLEKDDVVLGDRYVLEIIKL